MSKQDEYKLNFAAMKMDGYTSYVCTHWGTLEESYLLARLLDDCHPLEAKDLLEEIDRALNGKPFEEYFSLDSSMLSVKIVPPNIIIDNTLFFPLSEMGLLLQEWVRFCKM